MSCNLVIKGLNLIRTYNTVRTLPLNILFFGSDEFSVHSLRALYKLRQDNPHLINHLQVVTRPEKRCGRYLAETREMPIASFCSNLGLPSVLRCDSSQDMMGPVMDALKYQQVNMLVAVSFGKLIPKALIDQVPYTLNVHPSLLPRYKGSSPIQYTLMNQDKETGVSIQTLHPIKFDNGQLIAQSNPVQVQELLKRGTVSSFKSDVPSKVAVLMDQLGSIGANLLTKVLKEGLYAGNSSFQSTFSESYAPKIKTEMKRIDWSVENASQILSKMDALGAVYSNKESKPKNKEKALKRIIFHDLSPYKGDCRLEHTGEFAYDRAEECLVIRCRDGINLRTTQIQFEGFKVESCGQFMKSLNKRCGTELGARTIFL